MSPAETERAVERIRDIGRHTDVVIIEHDMEVVFGLTAHMVVMA